MKTVDAAGRPLSAQQLLQALDERSDILLWIATEVRRTDDPSGFLVEALASGVLAYIEEVEEASSAAALQGPESGLESDELSFPRPLNRELLQDRFTAEALLTLLTEFSHGFHNPVRSPAWRTEMIEAVDFDEFSIEDLEMLEADLRDALSRKRSGGA